VTSCAKEKAQEKEEEDYSQPIALGTFRSLYKGMLPEQARIGTVCNAVVWMLFCGLSSRLYNITSVEK
jgi:hypothetical protein